MNQGCGSKPNTQRGNKSFRTNSAKNKFLDSSFEEKIDWGELFSSGKPSGFFDNSPRSTCKYDVSLSDSKEKFLSPLVSPETERYAKDDSFTHYPMTKISPSIYLGTDQDACDDARLTAEKITHILSLVARKNPIDNKNIKRKCVPMSDTGNSHVVKLLEAEGVLAFMKESQEKENKLLVHCQMGQNRSPTILLAFLMKYQNITLYRAWRMVKPKRVIVHPHKNYIKQLRDWDVYLHGKHSTPQNFLKTFVSGDDIQVEHENVRTPQMLSVMKISRDNMRNSSMLLFSSSGELALDIDQLLSPSKTSGGSEHGIQVNSEISDSELKLDKDHHESTCDLLPINESLDIKPP